MTSCAEMTRSIGAPSHLIPLSDWPSILVSSFGAITPLARGPSLASHWLLAGHSTSISRRLCYSQNTGQTQEGPRQQAERQATRTSRLHIRQSPAPAIKVTCPPPRCCSTDRLANTPIHPPHVPISRSPRILAAHLRAARVALPCGACS